MQITEHIFQSFIRCPYKAHLLAKGDVGQKSEYEVLEDEVSMVYLTNVLRYGIDRGQPPQSFTAGSRDSKWDKELITGVQVAHDGMYSSCEIVMKNTGSSSP